MYKDNVIAIDIAKSVFQVCVFDKHNQIKSNQEIRRQKLMAWLAKHHITMKPRLVLSVENLSF